MDVFSSSSIKKPFFKTSKYRTTKPAVFEQIGGYLFFLFKAQEAHKYFVIFLGLIFLFLYKLSKQENKNHALLNPSLAGMLSCLYPLHFTGWNQGESRYNRPKWHTAAEVYHSCLVQDSHFPKIWSQIWIVWVLIQNPKEHTVILCVCLNLNHVGMSLFVWRTRVRRFLDKVIYIYIKKPMSTVLRQRCLQFHSSPKYVSCYCYFFGSWTLNSRFLFVLRNTKQNKQ